MTSTYDRHRREPVTPAKRSLLTTMRCSPALRTLIAELAGWKIGGAA